jgi:acyl-CoA synthetase (AMP-forming)/AMP-acid ligase II
MLYVTGRSGDIIIVRGKKFHGFDIEHVVSGVRGVKPGRTVAFPIENEMSGSEEAVVVAETDAQSASGDFRGLRTAIKRAAYDELGLVLAEVHLVGPHWIVKTTSGKISRQQNAEKYKTERHAYA